MDLKKSTEKSSDPVMVERKINVPITAFETRASRILKAALNSKEPLKERIPSLSEEQIKLRQAQQVDASKNRKRSPRNSVAFTNPVVSREHEYEPTYLDEIYQHDMQDEDEDEEDEDEHEQPAVGQAEHEESAKEGSKKTSSGNYTKNNTKKGYGGEVKDDDDDEDDLFIMTRSDETVAKEKKLIDRVSKNAPKRNHEAMDESDDDHSCDEKQAGKNESSGGGLFSSPKVAKIAPYFDDRPHERRAAEARVIQQNRAKAQLNNYNRSRSLNSASKFIDMQRTASVDHSISIKTRRQPSMNLQTHSRVTELLSYKKVSSPKLGDRNVIPATETTITTVNSDPTCKTEPQIPGYFNWFTTFITNQMNKLIF